jgi:hypothetical protein
MSGGPKTWACVSQAPFGTVQCGARVLGSGGKLTGTPEGVMQTSLFGRAGQSIKALPARPAPADMPAGPTADADRVARAGRGIAISGQRHYIAIDVSHGARRNAIGRLDYEPPIWSHVVCIEADTTIEEDRCCGT